MVWSCCAQWRVTKWNTRSTASPPDHAEVGPRSAGICRLEQRIWAKTSQTQGIPLGRTGYAQGTEEVQWER